MPSSLRKRFSSAAARCTERPQATALAIAVIAVVAHLHYFIVSADNHERWDSSQYLASARGLASGHGFVDAAGKIEARRTPVYPAFLVAFAPMRFNETAIAIVQHLFAAALAVTVFYLARSTTGNAVVAAVAGLLVAIDSGQIYMADKVMAETLMSITLFAAIAFLARGGFAAAGLMTGITVLVRPIAMYLWIPLALWIVVVQWRGAGPRTDKASRRAGPTLAALAFFLLAAWSLPLLWMWRNHERAGVASLSSIEGEILYYWRGAGVIAIERSGFQYSPLPFQGEERFRYQFFRVAQHELAANIEHLLGARAATMTEAQISAIEGQIGRGILRSHPREVVLLTIYGALHLIFDTTWDYAGAIAGGFLRVALIWWLYVVAVASFVLAIFGFARLRRVNAPFAWLLVTTLVYFVAVSSGPEHEQWRYRVPMIPLYSILIACCIIRRHAGLLRSESR